MEHRTDPGVPDDEGRKVAIVEAAARVFSEKGFSGATNRDIAREANVSPGLIYWYFENKEDLFKAVVRHLFPLYQLSPPESDAGEMNLQQVLTGFGSRFMSIVTQPEVLRLQRLMLTEINRFPDVTSQLGELIASEPIERLASTMDGYTDQWPANTMDMRLVAQAFLGSLVAFVLRKYHFRSPDLEDVSDEDMVKTVARIHAIAIAPDSAGRER